MAAHRIAASRSSAGDRASAEALPLEDEKVRDKTTSDSPPPRAGRTGSLGTRAERPADTRARKTGDGAAEPAEKKKGPSPAANESQGRADDLSQARRDPVT
jgi:hypothetical protein